MDLPSTLPAAATPPAPNSDSPPAAGADSILTCPLSGCPRLVDESVLRAALEALDAVINCEPFADVSGPGTEGFDVYEVVAAARERVAAALGDSV
jgi:hypothetical protein